jgi:hypothetical protein
VGNSAWGPSSAASAGRATPVGRMWTYAPQLPSAVWGAKKATSIARNPPRTHNRPRLWGSEFKVRQPAKRIPTVSSHQFIIYTVRPRASKEPNLSAPNPGLPVAIEVKTVRRIEGKIPRTLRHTGRHSSHAAISQADKDASCVRALHAHRIAIRNARCYLRLRQRQEVGRYVVVRPGWRIAAHAHRPAHLHATARRTHV